MARLFSTLVDHHDLRLVVLAGLVCVLACYTAFSLMARLSAPRSRYPWVVAAAVVTGCGSWATHSIALLAFKPGVPLSYDVGLTVLAGAIAVLGCGVGFLIARGTEQMALGGAIVGFAIGAMHYVAVAAVAVQAHKEWDILYVQVSLLVGASFAAAALSRAQITPDLRGRLTSTALLTTGICGTYFIGMAGLSFVPDPSIAIPEDTLAIVWFAIALTAVVLLILGLGVVGSLVDQHINEIEAAKRKLEAALKLAEAANKSKSKFLTTVSHELRSPLNVIIGFSELLKKTGTGADETCGEYVNNILDSGVQLLRLVNDILDISKFDAGRLELKDELVDLSEIATDCVRLMEAEAKKASLRVSGSAKTGLPLLRGDSKRLRQILMNLLSNAIKFTPQGGEVRVLTFLRNGCVGFSVADTGIGMTRQDMPRALERFGQIDSEYSRKYDGAGLGLPLAQHLIELHGGRLDIESEPGVGTTVRAIFPAERLVPEDPAVKSA